MALALFLSQALLKPGLPTTADLTIHLYRTLEYGQAWAPGVIVPRWAPNLAYGYGYPLFVFAPPLPYLLASTMHQLGLSLEAAFKILLILIPLLYAAGMYLLTRNLFDSKPAGLIAAVAFTFAPFALREALLYGGNVPQYLAIGLFPWPLWAAHRAARTGRWRWTMLSGLFYAAIILNHLFHALIFSPVFGLFLLLLVPLYPPSAQPNGVKLSPPAPPKVGEKSELPPFGGPGGPKSALLPLLAAPLGLALSAFFLIPAFTERYATRALANVYLEKSPFFVRYPYLPELLAWLKPLDTRAANPYVPLTLGLVTLALAGLGLLAALIRGRKNGRMLTFILFFSAVAAGAVFMTMTPSRPVWETIAILQVAEFPWRMLGLANLGLAVGAGAAVLLFPARWRAGAAVAIIALQLLAVAPLLFPVTGFTRFGTPTLADQIQYERSSQSIGTTTLGEYLPQAVTRPPTTSPLVEAFRAGQNPERLDRASLPPAARAELLRQNATTHRYRVDTPQPFTLRLNQFDYPGWQADLDGQPAPIRPEPATGLILVDVPAGTHTLTIHFGETPTRLVALTLTGLTLLAILLLVALRLIRRPAPPPSTGTPARAASLPQWLGVATIALLALLVTPRLRPLFTVTSPPGQVLPAQHAAAIRFANGIELAGYDLDRQIIESNGYANITLYWQTDAAPYRVNLQPFVHLDRLDDFTTVADATNYTPGDVTTETNLPTFHWDNSRYVRDEHDLIVPPGTPPLAYAVRIGLIDPAQGGALIPLADGRGDTAWLTTVNVAPSAAPEPLAQPLAASFSDEADTIALTGYEVTGQTPDELRFTLSWRAKRRPQQDYTVFAQLLDANGAMVASFDRPPLNGAYPTSTWLPGQTILDPRVLPLTGVPPGDYTLVVGLYQATTGIRLTTTASAGFIELTSVAVP
jgi:hypothetical protein